MKGRPPGVEAESRQGNALNFFLDLAVFPGRMDFVGSQWEATEGPRGRKTDETWVLG